MCRRADGSCSSVRLGNAPAPDPRPPFSGGCLLMRAHDGAIEHQVTAVAILRQRREDPLPHPDVRPPAEALVHRLPSAIALRQVTPVCARPKHPQTTVYEQSVVSSAASRITRLAG